MRNIFAIIIIGFIITIGCSKENLNQVELYKVLNNRFLSVLEDIDEKRLLNPTKYSELYKDAKRIFEYTESITGNLLDYNSPINSDIHTKLSHINKMQLQNLGEKKFEHCILLKNIDKLNKLKRNKNMRLEVANNLLSDNCYLLTEMLNKDGDGDATFNSFYPIILENSNEVKLGDVYSSKIYLAGYDSTYKFSVKTMDNDTLRVDYKCCAYYKFQTIRKGKHEYGGTIRLVNNKGFLVEIPFKKEFYVK